MSRNRKRNFSAMFFSVFEPRQRVSTPIESPSGARSRARNAQDGRKILIRQVRVEVVTRVTPRKMARMAASDTSKCANRIYRDAALVRRKIHPTRISWCPAAMTLRSRMSKKAAKEALPNQNSRALPSNYTENVSGLARSRQTSPFFDIASFSLETKKISTISI